MKHHRYNGWQARLFEPPSRIRLTRRARQAVRSAVAELIAQVLRPPAKTRRQGGSHDGTR